MAGLLSNITKNLPIVRNPNAIPEEELVGEIMGGPLVPRQNLPVQGGQVIDGELIPPGGGGLLPPPKGPGGSAGSIGEGPVPMKALLAGGAALGATALDDGVSVGGEGVSDPGVVIGEPLTTDTGEAINPRQNALIDATDMLVKDSGKSSAEVEQQMRETVPKKDLDWFDKFAGEFDLLTIGMALLASNDGSRPMAQNIGDAMIAGRAAAFRKKRLAKEDKSKEAAAEAAKRKEARDERRVAAIERELDIKAMKARNEAISADAKANGINLGTPGQSQIDEVADLANIASGDEITLSVRGKKTNQTDRAWAASVAREIELAEKKANAAGQTLSTAQRQQIVTDNLSGLVKDSTLFGIPTGGQKFDREAAQQQAQQGGVSNSRQAILDRIGELQGRQ